MSESELIRELEEQESEEIKLIMDYINQVVTETPEMIAKSCKDKNLQEKVKSACEELDNLKQIKPPSAKLQQHIEALKKYIILSNLSAPAGINQPPVITDEQYETIIDMYQKPFQGGRRKRKSTKSKRKSA